MLRRSGNGRAVRAWDSVRGGSGSILVWRLFDILLRGSMGFCGKLCVVSEVNRFLRQNKGLFFG